MGPLVVVVLGLLAIATVRLLADRLGVAAPLLLVLSASASPSCPACRPWRSSRSGSSWGSSRRCSSPLRSRCPPWTSGGRPAPSAACRCCSWSSPRFDRWPLTVLVSTWPRRGIALGALLSPTDAIATAIVRRLGVSSRVVTVLQGESLLNDATALVLLRSALAATAASVSTLDGRYRSGLRVRGRRRRGRRPAWSAGSTLMSAQPDHGRHGQHRDLVRGALRRPPAGRGTSEPPGLVAAVNGRARHGAGGTSLPRPAAPAGRGAELAHDRAAARGRGSSC